MTEILNAQKLFKEHSSEIGLPSGCELQEINAGAHVQIFRDGRFIWCEVDSLDGERLIIYHYIIDVETGEYDGETEWFKIEKRHVFRIVKEIVSCYAKGK